MAIKQLYQVKNSTSTPVGLTFDDVYPVGSIYMSVNNTNPGNLFGGTWVAWGSGRVPVGVNTSETEFNTVEKTGGAKSHSYTPAGSNSGGSVGNHTLTTNEIPAHTHGERSLTGTVEMGIYSVTSGKNDLFDNVNGVFSKTSRNANFGRITNAYHDAFSHVDGFIFNGTHTHDSVGGNGAHNHEFTNPTFTGTASTQSHLQPYITCYMWKRTA